MTTTLAEKPYMPICGDDYPLTDKQNASCPWHMIWGKTNLPPVLHS